MAKITGTDMVYLRFTDGTQTRVPWLGRLPNNKKCSLILVDRMPVTFDEEAWFWFSLPQLLAPRASIKMGKF